jgi:hypothetical protein
MIALGIILATGVAGYFVALGADRLRYWMRSRSQRR